jgi:hypothetical protein
LTKSLRHVKGTMLGPKTRGPDAVERLDSLPGAE